MKSKDLLWASALVTAGVLLGGCALLTMAYGLKLFSFPAIWWRDHPFDYGNILFTAKTMSLSSRIWAYDAYHLFGWTPNVFYNPLATFLASLFVGLGGGTEGAYRAWLLLVLLGSSLAFLPLLDRSSSRVPWILGGLTAAWMSFFIYPMDVGILDANPVQVLYTGQWAQRLGLALGVLSVERLFRSLSLLEKDLRTASRRALAAAMLLGASLFTHYMSGFAAAAVGTLLSVHFLLARRLSGGVLPLRTLLVLPATLLAAGLLFADFLYVLLSVQGSHHNLPLLSWRVSAGALETVRQVIVPALPLLLIPLAKMLISGEHSRSRLSSALLPLVVLLSAWAATPTSLLPWFLLVMIACLAASWLEKDFCPRHWLPSSAFFLLLLSCGPDSLRVFGLDLSVMVPFSGSIGWAKLTAFSRFLFLAWFGVLVAEGLAHRHKRNRTIGRMAMYGLALLGLLVPLMLSIAGDKRETGAQSFFGRMNQTDRAATRALLQRMQGVAARTPENGYLLVEDTLHHSEGSALLDRRIPNGHLPYLTGRESSRPVLGGSVTTRLITHPLAHTSRGKFLCKDFSRLTEEGASIFDRLRVLGISDILAHSPELIRALQRYPAALEVDAQAGMTHFALEQYRPVLTDGSGLHLSEAKLIWKPDGLAVELPAGTSTALLRQVYYPFLRCTAIGPGGEKECTLSSWTEGRQTFSDCLVDDPRDITAEVPWIHIQIDPDTSGPLTVRISSQPSLVPFFIMLFAWLAAGLFRLWSGRRKPEQT